MKEKIFLFKENLNTKINFPKSLFQGIQLKIKIKYTLLTTNHLKEIPHINLISLKNNLILMKRENLLIINFLQVINLMALPHMERIISKNLSIQQRVVSQKNQ